MYPTYISIVSVYVRIYNIYIYKQIYRLIFGVRVNYFTDVGVRDQKQQLT
jgi:hypothetical protein